MRIVKRPLFLLDVEQCAEYLATESNEPTARRWKDSLNKAIALISKFPEIGQIRRDLPIQNIRTFFLKGFPRYLIFYRWADDEIELLRVRHGMMHLPGLFE